MASSAPLLSNTAAGDNAQGLPAVDYWVPLGYFAIYRLLLAGLLVILHLLQLTPAPFGSHAPTLYVALCYGYLAAAFVAAVAVRNRMLPFNTLVDIHTFTDIVFITLLMHASGGVGSGLGMLLVVSVAAAGLLSMGRTATLFAALASLAVLVEQSYLSLNAPDHITREAINYPQAGMLGATLFATAALAHTLARRIRASERLARQRGIDLANMAQLTDYVIQHMQTGVLVADAGGQIRLINATARQLLGLGAKPLAGTPLGQQIPSLQKQLMAWREGGRQESDLFEVPQTGQQVLPRFMPIGNGTDSLIFLEDASDANQRAQQLKLASLGRLTASIAHEIRNPLGAISHAGELLEESPGLENGDKRLLRIILEQSKRINAIIESVLHLGRRDRAHPERIELSPWLQRFLEEFQRNATCHPGDIRLNVEPADLAVQFDPIQLHQIVWNLSLNGLRHAAAAPAPKLEISAGRSGQDTWLDVRDHGPGIPPEVAEHLFEPFFTTEGKGTGLGLYLARELTESNRARLICLPPPDGGARFRLLFARSPD
jgi:two-component system sensor histidine kinase PilS (NtrC family)